MRPIALAFTAFLVASPLCPAAEPPAPAPPAASAMKKLDWLVGEWEGEGWMQLGPGDKRTFRSQELVESRLDGTVLIVEGKHYGKPVATVQSKEAPPAAPEVLVHHALAVVSWDPRAERFRFLSHLADGRYVAAEGKLRDDGSFEWGFKEPERGVTVRYVIRRNDKGQWSEVGEFSRDGVTFVKNFEMTLSKKGAARA